MKSIWIPHIPKNGGMTIIHSLSYHKKYLIHDKKELQIYKNNQCYLHLRHDNPLKKEMNDWLKILIVRDPIDRFISFFNFVKWRYFFKNNFIDKRTINEFIETYPDPKIDSKLYGGKFLSHLHFLNFQQINDDFIVFDKNNIKDIFDYILDISEIKKVFNFIEIHFLEKKIKWIDWNTSEKNIAALNKHARTNFKVFKKEDLNEDQLNKLKILLKDDIEFYEFVL